VLLSAYACEPGKGSEPGIGWNLARHLAEHHEVWVLTRTNNRPAIEAELARNPVPGLHFVYHDLPPWARFWKRGQRGSSSTTTSGRSAPSPLCGGCTGRWALTWSSTPPSGNTGLQAP
jgi:hypothetical protein